MKFPKTLKHVNVWESTTIKIPIADNIMNFLFDFVRCALMEFVYPHILWLFKFSSNLTQFYQLAYTQFLAKPRFVPP